MNLRPDIKNSRIGIIGSKMHGLFSLMIVDLCEIVANFWSSSNVPRPLFQNQSDMKFGIQKPYLQCENMWDCITTIC